MGRPRVFFALGPAAFDAALDAAFFGLPWRPKFTGRSACSPKGPFDPTGRLRNDAWLGHGGRYDVGIVALPCGALMEKIAVRAQASSAAFMDGAAIAWSKKPSEVW